MKGNISLRTARIISTIFVPPSITILVFPYFAFKFEQDLFHQAIVFFTALLFGFAIPVALVLTLRHYGKIVDADATIKEERLLPFFIGIFIYTSGFLILYFSKVNQFTLLFWFCHISNSVVILLITKYWKISAHTLGVAGPLAALTYVLGVAAVPFFVLLLIVGWARIKLKVHTINQVIAGAMLGFLFTYFQIDLFMRYL